MNRESEYFNWLASMAIPEVDIRDRYSQLLIALYSTEFYYLIPMDRNRYSDGIDLRYRFGEERNIPYCVINQEIDNKDCTVLEMMVALASRCETNIMSDDNYGDRTETWFMAMIKSLGLYEMTNDKFNIDYVSYHLGIFLDRRYEFDGSGGLFTVPNPPEDLRSVEIWYQMCWYLDTIFK